MMYMLFERPEAMTKAGPEEIKGAFTRMNP